MRGVEAGGSFSSALLLLLLRACAHAESEVRCDACADDGRTGGVRCCGRPPIAAEAGRGCCIFGRAVYREKVSPRGGHTEEASTFCSSLCSRSDAPGGGRD